MNIGIIGGGRAAAVLLDYFHKLPDADVVIISDLHTDAPGMVRAKALGVRTTTDMIQVLKARGLDTVIELTGVAAVQAKVFAARSEKGVTWDLITAGSARLMCDMIDHQNRQVAGIAEEICSEFDRLSNITGAAVRKIEAADHKVEELIREARLVTVNGRIEASRLGEQGAGFATLVDRLNTLIGQIAAAATDINDASEDTEKTLADLRAAEEKLRRELIQDDTPESRKAKPAAGQAEQPTPQPLAATG